MRKINFNFKVEPGENDRVLINIFENRFSEFLEKSEGKLNQYVQNDNLEIKDVELYKLLLDSLDNIVIVGSYINWNEFFSQFDMWDVYPNMDQFLLWMQQYIDDRSSAYKEAKLVREMKHDVLQKVVDHCFDEYILVYNDFEEEYLELNQKQVITIVKILRTLISIVIENNYSYKSTKSIAYGLFVWSEDIFKIFWNVINKNYDTLWKIIVMQKLNSLEDELENIKKMK